MITGHARERLQERYGINPTVEEAAEIIRSIKNMEAVFQGMKSGAQIYCVNWRGRMVRVVLREFVIITVIPYMNVRQERTPAKRGKRHGRRECRHKNGCYQDCVLCQLEEVDN